MADGPGRRRRLSQAPERPDGAARRRELLATAAAALVGIDAVLGEVAALAAAVAGDAGDEEEVA